MAMNVGQGAEMNVTPLIDVLLVLIIIFMVIAPTRSLGLRTAVPEESKDEARAEAAHPVVVTVREDGMAALNQELMGLAALRTRLEELYRTAATRVIFVRGDKNIEFGRVAEVIALARDAGVSQVALMTN